MGSLEVYNHQDRKWVLYVPDVKKWEQHFVDVSTELVFPDHKERYIIGSGSRRRPKSQQETPKIELVTPVAQAIEMAKSEQKREGNKINQITDYAALGFLIPSQSVGYMDLKRSCLKVKVRLVDSSDKPIGEYVGLVNLELHSIFSLVDCSLQQTPLEQTRTNYPYKAYIDTLLTTSNFSIKTLQVSTPEMLKPDLILLFFSDHSTRTKEGY